MTESESNNKAARRRGIIIGSITGAVAALIAFRFVSPMWFYRFLNAFDAHRVAWLFIMMTTGSVLLGAITVNKREVAGEYRWKDSESADAIAAHKVATRFTAAASLLAVLTAAFAVLALMYGSYLSDKVYLSAVQYSNSSVELGARTPWPVAQRRAANALATDTVAGYEVTNTKKGQTALTEARGGFFNNAPYASVVSLDGERCSFSREARARLGGWFSANLNKMIVEKAGNVYANPVDAWAYCDGNTPYVVAPLTRWTHPNLLQSIRVPAGVAVYNGESGEIRIVDGADAALLPGPVYPLSVAAAQRDALRVLDNTKSTPVAQGWWSYIRGRLGWSDTGSDENDPNAGNATELTFTVGDSMWYSTPLTVVGRSTAITARSDVNASSHLAGKLGAISITRYPVAFQSGSVTVSEIKKTFPNVGWDTGMRVYEVYPATTEIIRASIGQENDLTYQVRAQRGTTGWEYCLSTIDGKRERCASANEPVRALDPFEGSGVIDNGGTTTGPKTELKKLTDAELIALIQQAAKELASRK